MQTLSFSLSSASWGRRVTALMLCSTSFLAGCLSDPAPQMTFTNLKGEVIAPSDYQSEVMLVNFWATSCTTCVKEMPDIVDTYRKFEDKDFRVIAVAMQYDRPDYVVNFAQTRQLPFDVVLDLKGEIAKSYGDVKLTPTTFLVNRAGNIVKTYVGEPDFPALNALIESELAKPKSS